MSMLLKEKNHQPPNDSSKPTKHNKNQKLALLEVYIFSSLAHSTDLHVTAVEEKEINTLRCVKRGSMSLAA